MAYITGRARKSVFIRAGVENSPVSLAMIGALIGDMGTYACGSTCPFTRAT